MLANILKRTGKEEREEKRKGGISTENTKMEQCKRCQFCIAKGVSEAGYWMRRSHGNGESRFFEDVNRACGEGVLTGTSRKASLHVTRSSHATLLRQAKHAVETCNSRDRKLDNACISICNIAAVLDVANVKLVGVHDEHLQNEPDPER
jgi:hypothetical protein